MIKFTIGTDCEFFVKNSATGNYVSAIPIFKGTKERPEILLNGSGLMYDNVAGEFATPVATGKEELCEYICDSYSLATLQLPTWHCIHITPSAIFPVEELVDPEAKRAGCDPDFNIWTMSVNKPADLSTQQLRSAGGHIHVGFESHKNLMTFKKKIAIIKLMDCFHGLYGVLFDNTPESSRRRELYGKAGCFRDKKYGIEYRTLSNFWTTSIRHISNIYDLTEDVLVLSKKGHERFVLKIAEKMDIVSIINSGNRDKAITFFTAIKKYMQDSVRVEIEQMLEGK